MTTISRNISSKTLKVTETFTNFFGQTIYKLEDGTQLFIKADDSEIEIVMTEPFESDENLYHFLNSQPDDEVVA